MSDVSVVAVSGREERKSARIFFGRVEVRWYARAKRSWTYRRLARHDSISKRLGFARFLWLALGPVDVRFFYRRAKP